MISGTFELIQVGETALRDPVTKDWGIGIPLYVIADETSKAQEQSLVKDFAALAAMKYKDYMAQCEAQGVNI